MDVKRALKKYDTTVFIEELKKRVIVAEDEYQKFLQLWEFKHFKRNEFILRAGLVPKFSIFVLKGCLRQYVVNSEGEESIIYFAEERHFLGDLSSMRDKTISNFNFQAIEECELLVISAENWEKASVEFPWWTEAHVKGYQKWVAKMQQQMVNLQSQTGEERYLNLLKERPSLFLRVPQHYIASFLGLSAETLSRIRKKQVS